MAKLYFRYGSMNSGKSAYLLQAVHNYEERGMNVIVMKPKVDSKGEDYIVSRIGLKRKVDHLVDDKENVFLYVKDVCKDISCIFVDEAQFLLPEQVDQLMMVVIDMDIPVICYGLRTDFQTRGFPGASRLLEISHTIEEMKTICSCGKKAIFNGRKVGDKFSFVGSQVAIDGEDKVAYVSLCPKCYYHKLSQFQKIKNNLKKS